MTPEGPLLLVADDEPAGRPPSLCSEGRGDRLVFALDGATALWLAYELRPDLDVMRPAMDGFEAIRGLRADDATRDTPVVAVTALAMTGDRERCLEAGADEYLTKPFRLEDLRAVVRRLVGGPPAGGTTNEV